MQKVCTLIKIPFLGYSPSLSQIKVRFRLNWEKFKPESGIKWRVHKIGGQIFCVASYSY